MHPLAEPLYELVEPKQGTLIPPARRDVIRSRWPFYGADEIEAVAEVLRSGRVNALHHGERCRAFEEAFAAASDMPHAIALANGTLALELALRALEVGAGDEVVVTPRSFVASAACVVACGARPVFADVDLMSQNLTADSIARVLTPRTKAVIVVHLAGWPCAMDEIVTLARGCGLHVIEDCAQAHGATYDGRPVGSFGDAAAFSFCTDKIMSTGGEGGLLLLRDDAVWARAWSFKDHGKKPGRTTTAAPGASFRWLHESFGSNYRLTEMQAAIGLIQLAKLPHWLAQRRCNAAILNACLSGLAALRLTIPPESVGHAYYKYYAFLRPEGLRRGWDRRRVVEAAIDAGVPCVSGTCSEIYLEKAFKDAGIGPRCALPNAAELGELSLMLPVDPTLDEVAVRLMGQRLRKILEAAGD